MLPSIDDLWDDEEEKKHFSKVIYSHLILGFFKGAGDVGGSDHPEILLTLGTRYELGRRSLEYAAKSIGTTKEALRVQITLAVEAGESVRQLAGRIDTLFGRTMG